MLLIFFFFNLTPAFKFLLQKSCVSCEEGAQRLLPTSSSPSGCFPPTVPVDRNTSVGIFPIHDQKEVTAKGMQITIQEGKKKIILTATWDFWNEKLLGYSRRNQKT